MVKRSSVSQLPEEVKHWLNNALMKDNFSGYQQLEELLRAQGFVISKSAIHRYGQNLERRLSAIKASTEAARILTEGAADDQDARSEAVIALVQTELFETIVNLQEATSEDIEPEQRVKLLSSAAKNIATLTRASVNLKKFQSEVREKIREEERQKAAEALAHSAKANGVSPETVEIIRRDILGMKS